MKGKITYVAKEKKGGFIFFYGNLHFTSRHVMVKKQKEGKKTSSLVSFINVLKNIIIIGIRHRFNKHRLKLSKI